MGKRGPPPTGKGTTIGVRCQDDFIKALDAWRGGQAVPPSRASALRHLAEEGLRAAASAWGNKQKGLKRS